MEKVSNLHCKYLFQVETDLAAGWDHNVQSQKHVFVLDIELLYELLPLGQEKVKICCAPFSRHERVLLAFTPRLLCTVPIFSPITF
jgi:hypothetical protein